MKKYLRSLIALLLVLTMGIQTPVRAFAESQTSAGPDYISEVKIAMGGDAENALEGYVILKDENGKAVDLNKDAGGGWGSQGDRRVILGYKTTKLQTEAITDLAVMNMKGGYDVQEYEALIQQRMDSQVIPFIQKFQTTINEYRENINSDDEVNRTRAEYVREALNKFTDDDCSGTGLGDLFLNETKFEMGDEAYDKLPTEEKKKHCDIVTLFMQADGQLMLLVTAYLTRAADPGEDSWIERFSNLTYDSLMDSYDMSPADAKIQAAKDFEDDARLLLQNWGRFFEFISSTDEAVDAVDRLELPDMEALGKQTDEALESTDAGKQIEAIADLVIAEDRETKAVELASAVTTADYLESIGYEDGTLLDFFMKSSTEIEKNITVLYPLVASLSEGQRAGLEFISLRELVMAGNRDSEYDMDDLKDVPEVSVYEGVDRGIYEKGGVALTWSAKRKQALEAEQNLADRSFLSTRTIVLYALTGAAAMGFIGSVIGWGVRSHQLSQKLTAAKTTLEKLKKDKLDLDWKFTSMNQKVLNAKTKKEYLEFSRKLDEVDKKVDEAEKAVKNQEKVVEGLSANTPAAAWMSAGFAAAMLVLAGVSLYLTWEDMKNYYKVDFSPIPHYMVDDTAITYYNEAGQQMVKENHAAYYKAVTVANRTDKKYIEVLEDCADLNGDVGQQWIALYACWDYKANQPILADSLKVVSGSNEIPAGYETGIHMFGSDSAFNLNNKLYDWNQSAKSIFVYFQTDKNAPMEPATSASAFSGGWIALAAVLGMGLGAAVTAVSMTAIRKKKEGVADA